MGTSSQVIPQGHHQHANASGGKGCNNFKAALKTAMKAEFVSDDFSSYRKIQKILGMKFVTFCPRIVLQAMRALASNKKSMTQMVEKNQQGCRYCIVLMLGVVAA